MKRLLVLLMSLIVVIAFSSMASAASLALKGTWTANTEVDLAGYNIWRTDVTPAVKVNPTLIAAPAVQYLFTLTVPDNSQGTLTFELEAVDTNANVSPRSLPASYNYNVDMVPPARPVGFGVTKQ